MRYLQFSVNLYATTYIDVFFCYFLAPSAPGNFRVTAFDSTSLAVAWDVPDPINGQLATYELRYSNEASSVTNVRIIFFAQFTITGLQVGAVYRVEVRASTIGLLGNPLWGPYAVLRVRDGVELEVPTEAPPTTAVPTTLPPTPPPTTTEVLETMEPTTQEVGVATTTTEVIMTTEVEAETTAPPATTMPDQTTSLEITTTAVVLNPPTVAPSEVLVHVPAGTFGQVEVVWRVSILQ